MVNEQAQLLPGRWISADHKTRPFMRCQIRRRVDGDFDIREIWAREPHFVHRGVSANYAYAEFVLPDGLDWDDLSPAERAR